MHSSPLVPSNSRRRSLNSAGEHSPVPANRRRSIGDVAGTGGGNGGTGGEQTMHPSPIPTGPSRRKSLPSIEGSADNIKVICRFRPPTKSLKAASGKDGKGGDIDSFKLNEANASVEFISDFQDHKLFSFDKVFTASFTSIKNINYAYI